MITTTTSKIESIASTQAARIAGIGYVIVFLLGIFANFFAYENLIVPGNASSTFYNIIANESLFRFGVASWFIIIACDIIVAWALYLFLKPINKDLALLAAWFRLIFVAILSSCFVNHFSILQLLSNADYLEAFESNQLHAQMMILLNAHKYGTHISFVFFGIHLFIIGYLIFKSSFIPRILGVMLIIASIGYLIDSFGNFLSSEYANNKTMFIVFVAIPAMISEFSLTLWLLIQGTRLPKN